MKQRFISFLLSAVMLLTMLPVTAFAAGVTGSIIDIKFYADSAKTKEAVEDLFSEAVADKESFERDTLFIKTKGLTSSVRYKLTLTYPNGTSPEHDVELTDIDDESGRQTVVLESWKADASDKLDKLHYVSLKRWSDSNADSFDGLGEGEYTVKLWQQTGDNINNPDWVQEYTLVQSEDINLAEVTVDFGAGAEPTEIITQAEDKEDEYFYSIDSKRPTAVRFFVDADDLDMRNTKPATLINKLKEWLNFEADVPYIDADALNGTWSFISATNKFEWSTPIESGSIIFAPLYDGNVIAEFDPNIYKAEVTGKLKETTSANDYQCNEVYITAPDLVKHGTLKAETDVEYYVGFAVVAPENATDVQYLSATDENTIKNATNFEKDKVENLDDNGTRGYYFYVDASADTPELYHSIQFYNGKNAASKRYCFKMILDDVSLNTTARYSSAVTDGKISATVKEAVVEELMNANEKNKGTNRTDILTFDVAPKVALDEVTSATVDFEAKAVKALKASTDIKLNISTPIGSVEMPVTHLPTVNNEKLRVTISRRSDGELANIDFESSVSKADMKIDLFDINIYKVGTQAELCYINSSEKDITLSLKLNDVKTMYDRTSDDKARRIDALYFNEFPVNTENPVIFEKDVPFVDADAADTVTFDVDRLSAYKDGDDEINAPYGVALRSLVNKMYTTDPDASIILREGSTSGTDLIPTFVETTGKENRTYNVKTSANAVFLKLSEGARIVAANNSERELDKDTFEKIDITDRTSLTIQVKIGARAYNIAITKVVGTGETLTLSHDFSIKGLDKVTITNAKKNRFYYVQVDTVKYDSVKNEYHSVATPNFYVIRTPEDDNKAEMYLSLYSASSDYKIWLSIWEVSENADEPLAYYPDVNRTKVVFNEATDRVVYEVEINRKNIEANQNS